MKFRPSSVLGLAITDRAIVCAQVAGDAKARVVQKLARFTLAADSAIDRPDALGASLGKFLEEHGFSANRAVIGVPARWLISQERELPPVSAAEARSILLLHAERMSIGDGAALAVDVDGALNTGGGPALMVGMLRQRLEQLQKMAEAASLSLVGVTSSALVVSRVVGVDTHAALLVVENGLEVVVRRGGLARMVRHISFAGAKPEASPGLSSELRRAIAVGGSEVGSEQQPLLLWDGSGTGAGTAERLIDNMRLRSSQPSVDSLRTSVDGKALNGAAASGGVAGHLPAVALALAGMADALPVDFLHSRLVAPPARRFGRRTVWITAVAAAAVLGLVLLYTTVTSREAELVRLDDELRAKKPDITAAETAITHADYGRTYFENRPALLECMRQLSLAFPYDETIFMTSLTLRDNKKGQFQGSAAEQRSVLALLDRIKSNKRFSEVQLMDMRQSGAKGGETSFSISFNFSQAE